MGGRSQFPPVQIKRVTGQMDVFAERERPYCPRHKVIPADFTCLDLPGHPLVTAFNTYTYSFKVYPSVNEDKFSDKFQLLPNWNSYH